MADLVTHLCTALLPGAFLAGRGLGPVAVGTVLPDLLSRVVPLGLLALDDAELVRVPQILLVPWGVLHEPVGLFLASLLSGMVVIERDRPLWVGGVLLGCAMHVSLDALQFHHGQGYYLLAPFSLQRFEWGLIGSEGTVDIALPLAVLTALAWLGRWRFDRRG